VIVQATVDRHLPASEERLKCVQHRIAPRSLYDRKLRLGLPAEAARSVSEDRDAKTSLAVDEADDPLRSKWPFLLIVRTRRFVTVHEIAPYEEGETARTSTAGCTGFPAFGQLHSPGSLLGGAVPGHVRALVDPYVAIGLGPYLRLTRRGEVAGVWSLRIPLTATVYAGSWSGRPPQSAADPPPEGVGPASSCE